MRKGALLFVLVVCVFVFGAEPVRAASELETWCTGQGQVWDAAISRCTVGPGPMVTVSGALTVLSGEVIANWGIISNSNGTIYNYGAIRNEGIIDNHGTIYNAGFIYNWNFNAITNYGTIYNLCKGVIGPFPPVHYVDGKTFNLDKCVYLPLVTSS